MKSAARHGSSGTHDVDEAITLKSGRLCPIDDMGVPTWCDASVAAMWYREMWAMSKKKIELTSSIHEDFKKGLCSVVVGAGASIASGLPSWKELNSQLLILFLKRHASDWGDLQFQTKDVRQAARVFMESFGPAAVVDVVRKQLEEKAEKEKDEKDEKDEEYFDLLRDAIYGQTDKGPPDKAVSNIHLEVAAWVTAQHEEATHRAYTFNFDNYLEQAIWRVSKREALSISDSESESKSETNIPWGRERVIHLHGYLPFRGAHQGGIILSEEDYYRAQDSWSDRMMTDLLIEPWATKKRSVLLVGLSLTDPRLRRFLLDRMKKTLENPKAQRPEVYVLLDKPSLSEDAALMERAARQLVRSSEERFWSSWNVKILSAERGLVPFYLRRMRLGSEGKSWVQKGSDFLKDKSKVYPVLYEEDTQKKLRTTLKEVCRYLKHQFALTSDEQLQLGGFVPNPLDSRAEERDKAHLQIGFRYNEAPRLCGVLSEEKARKLRLDVAKIDEPQGAAGRAYIWGCEVEGSIHDLSADPWLKPDELTRSTQGDEWAEMRTFASVLCIPLADTPELLPIGVMFLASNKKQAFWQRLKPREFDGLKFTLQQAYRGLLQYESIWDKQRETSSTAAPLGQRTTP